MTGLQQALLGWAEGARRDLPWRRTRDPWAILVSELMLQQTQVPRVIPRYEAFLARFPTAAACASAPAADVLRLWAGLGYNRRALHLHRAAAAMASEQPRTLDTLLQLPGVGAYTARAVLAFAFERDVGVIDANAARALSRALGRPVAQADADALVPRGRAWAWNQAVLDLGATVCRARPACTTCPLAGAGACAWHAAGQPGPDPWPRGPRQSPFAGSDRQGRGRLIAALRDGPLPGARVAETAGWPSDEARARRIANQLIAEGMVVEADGVLQLTP